MKLEHHHFLNRQSFTQRHPQGLQLFCKATRGGKRVAAPPAPSVHGGFVLKLDLSPSNVIISVQCSVFLTVFFCFMIFAFCLLYFVYIVFFIFCHNTREEEKID